MSTRSVRGPAAGVTDTGAGHALRAGENSPAGRRRNLGWVFAAVWLVFLGYPVVAVLSSDKSIAATTYGVATVVAFAAVYTLACIRVMPFRATEIKRREMMTFFVVLLALVLLSTPVLGSGAMGMAPYLMALGVFGLPPRGSIAVVVVTIGAAVVLPEVVPGWRFDGGTLTAVVVSGVVMLVARSMQLRERDNEAAEARKRELDEQLAVIAERERVARDVHDILGHSLTVMTVKSELAGRLVDIDPERAKAELAELHSMSRKALAEVRATVGGLRTPDLRTELASARTALDAAAIDADLPTQLCEIPQARGALFAWVIRESVTNVVRHSGANRCTVTLDPGRIEVLDDGHGISEHAFGNGLRGLTERVEAAGGNLTVEATGSGTAVRVTVG